MTEMTSKMKVTNEAHRILTPNYVETITTVITFNNEVGEVLTIVSDSFEEHSMMSVTLKRGEQSATLYLGRDEHLLDDSERLVGVLRKMFKPEEE